MSLAPIPGSYVRVLLGSGAENTYTNEAMEEVDLSAAKWSGHAANTVWRIADVAKRIMSNSVAPVFQYDPDGGTDWEALTPTEIWYGAGYIITADLGATAVVRCQSGKYLTPSTLIGCDVVDTTDKTECKECTACGDSAKARYPVIDDWEANLEAFVAKKQAELTTSGGAANSHINLRHLAGGTGGNSITLTITDTDQAVLSVAVAGNDITVDLKTSGGTPNSTANEVIAAINTDADCQALGVHAFPVAGETGAGVVAAMVQTALAGGLGYVDFVGLKGVQAAFRFYNDYDSGEMYVGFGYIAEVKWLGKPEDLIKAGLKVMGHGYQLRHVIESYA